MHDFIVLLEYLCNFVLPYSEEVLRTVNFPAFEDFTTASKLIPPNLIIPQNAMTV